MLCVAQGPCWRHTRAPLPPWPRPGPRDTPGPCDTPARSGPRSRTGRRSTTHTNINQPLVSVAPLHAEHPVFH